MGIQRDAQFLKRHRVLPPAKEAVPLRTREQNSELVQDIRADLDEVTERMNRVLSHAEKVFEGLGLHKEAGIPLVVGADERGSVRKRTKQHSLRWQLLNGRWQMVVETRQQAKGGGTFTSTIPLLCTSRQTRVEALGLIKEFHAALVAASSV